MCCTHLVEDDVEDMEPWNPQSRGQDPQPKFTPLALPAPTLLQTLQELLLTCHGGWVGLNIPQGGGKILSPPGTPHFLSSPTCRCSTVDQSVEDEDESIGSAELLVVIESLHKSENTTF